MADDDDGCAMLLLLIIVVGVLGYILWYANRPDYETVTAEPQQDGSCRFSPSGVDLDDGFTVKVQSLLTGIVVLSDPQDLTPYHDLEPVGQGMFEYRIKASPTMPAIRCSTTGVRKILAETAAGQARDDVIASLDWPELDVSVD